MKNKNKRKFWIIYTSCICLKYNMLTWRNQQLINNILFTTLFYFDKIINDELCLILVINCIQNSVTTNILFTFCTERSFFLIGIIMIRQSLDWTQFVKWIEMNRYIPLTRSYTNNDKLRDANNQLGLWKWPVGTR